MSFAEVNVLGVYVAPMSVMLLAAWVIAITLRRVIVQFDLIRYVWHPALFMFSLYLIVLSSITFIVARTP
jgi:protein AaeX